jgi:hypothetical protein
MVIRCCAFALFFLAAASVFAQEQSLPLESSPPGEITAVVDAEYKEPPEEAEVFQKPESPPRPESPFAGALRTVYRYFSDPAETRRHEPLRYFDWKLFIVNAGTANNFIGASDILRETIQVNGAELVARAADGVRLNTDIVLRSALDFNGKTGGFGAFFQTDGRIDFIVSQDVLALIAHGTGKNTSMTSSFTASGAVFSEVGFHRYFDADKLRVDVRPAWFLPLVYIPQSDVSVSLETTGGLTVETIGTLTAYLPVNFDERGMGMLDNYGGLDISATVEYALFPILDIGLGISHIPFMPARLTNQASVTVDGSILREVSLIDLIMDPGSLDIQFNPDYALGTAEKYVTRPFTMDMWMLWRPLRTDFLTVKPNIGFTANTPADTTFLNMGIELEMDVARIFFLRARSGLRDGIWRHGAGFSVNLRLFQLDVDATLASQEYLPAWSGRGISVGFGLRAGW